MAETNKRSLAEIFRPSKEVRETIAAGSSYEPGKSAIQFYGNMAEELKARTSRADETIKEYRTRGYDTQINDDGKLIMSVPDDLDRLIVQMIETTKFLAACRDAKQTAHAMKLLAEVRGYEENYTNKKGMAELGNLLKASDALTAASLTEESH